MAYGDFKDLPRRTASERVFRAKTFNIAKTLKFDVYQTALVSMIHKFFDAKSCNSGVKSEIISRQQLAQELHEAIIRKFEKRKVPSSFENNTWSAEIFDWQLIRNSFFVICY